MAHLYEYALTIEPKQEGQERYVLVRNTDRKYVEGRMEAFNQSTEWAHDVRIEESLIRVDVKQLVINLMGSSMGDLELVDVLGVASDQDFWNRHHVLRRKAFEDVRAGQPLAALRHKVESNGEYEWQFTYHGLEYLLENSLVGSRNDALAEWAVKAQKTALTIREAKPD